MIGVDTNVLVRYLVEDDPAQCARAAAFVEGAFEAGHRIFVTQVVLCELVWVLDTTYEFSRADIVPLLERVVRARQVVVEELGCVLRALDLYRKGKADFADYLILERSRAAGCERVGTFDRGLRGVDGVVSP